MAAAEPTWLSVIAIPLPFWVGGLAIAPTIVTSRPSRIQTVPSPTTTSQCQRDPPEAVHPRRDLRLGRAQLDVGGHHALLCRTAPHYPVVRTRTRRSVRRIVRDAWQGSRACRRSSPASRGCRSPS